MTDKETIKEAIKEALFEYDTYKKEQEKKVLPPKISKNQAIKRGIVTRTKLEKLISTQRLQVQIAGSGNTSTIYIETKKLLALKDLII